MARFVQNDIEILYRDEDLVIVEKPSGLLVHPSAEAWGEKEFLLHLTRDKLGHYLYPIHRLDRATSGPVIFGLNPDIIRQLQKTWHQDSTQKIYTALCWGHPPEQGVFDFALQDDNKVKKPAQTHYRVLEHLGEYSLVEASLKTGRRHQIRRHFEHARHHLLNDARYGKGRINRPFRERSGLMRLFLHCHHLSFLHPRTLQIVTVHSALPPDLQSALSKLRAL